MSSNVIAIDGPAASGKSSAARKIAARARTGKGSAEICTTY